MSNLLGVGTVPVGKIETGVLKPGMVLTFSPAKLTAEVKSIEMHHQGLQTALPGHNVGFNIKNVAVKNLRRGDVAGNSQQDPPSDVSSFIAQVHVILQSGENKHKEKKLVFDHKPVFLSDNRAESPG